MTGPHVPPCFLRYCNVTLISFVSYPQHQHQVLLAIHKDIYSWTFSYLQMVILISILFNLWKNLSLAMIIAGFCTTPFIWSIIFTTRRLVKDKYPPGPPALPFFGNLFQLSMDAWLQFTVWKSTFGPLVYINVAGQPVIVLNNHKVAIDLLDKRADIYSDRPNCIVASEFLAGGLLVTLMHPGDMWRRVRRTTHDCLRLAVVDHQTQAREAILLADGLLKNPSAWKCQFHRAMSSMMMTLVYDTPVLENEDNPSVTQLNELEQRLAAAPRPGLVDFFTWMRYLPLWMAKWKNEALEHYKKDSIMLMRMYDDASGDQHRSFCSLFMQNGDKYGLNPKEASWLAGTLYGAGYNTTSATLSWFLLAMVVFPNIQRKAQTELDEVVGRGQLSRFADSARLPYIHAIVKETLRWRPVVPMALPHRVTDTVVTISQRVPFASRMAINHDPDVYGADAHEFNPARHLDGEGKIKPALADTKEESHVSYGFGRRICPGRHLSNSSLFIDIATILWALTVEPAKDENGADVIPDIQGSVNTSVVVLPLPFDCVTRPRFSDAASLLAQAKEDIGQ